MGDIQTGHEFPHHISANGLRQRNARTQYDMHLEIGLAPYWKLTILMVEILR